MKLLLPTFTSIIALLFMPVVASGVMAANLKTSNRADFSTDVRNFNAGETVYVKIDTDNAGDSGKVLNIRDNQYNFLSSVALTKSGNTFSASFSAPSAEGYYSLEAKITSALQNTTSVKTIKIGASGESVKVNVNSKVQGESVSSTNQSSNQQKSSSPFLDKGASVARGDSNTSGGLPEDVQKTMEVRHDIFYSIGVFIGEIWKFIWPFKSSNF